MTSGISAGASERHRLALFLLGGHNPTESGGTCPTSAVGREPAGKGAGPPRVGWAEGFDDWDTSSGMAGDSVHHSDSPAGWDTNRGGSLDSWSIPRPGAARTLSVGWGNPCTHGAGSGLRRAGPRKGSPGNASVAEQKHGAGC